MRLPALCAIAASALLATPAGAAPEASGRYAMTRIHDGVLRLDTATGAVSVCRREDGEWACEAVRDPHLDLQREVEALRGENAALRAEIGRAERDGDAPPEATDKKQDRLMPDEDASLSAEKTIDEMMAVFESMMRRFRDMIESLEERKDERQL